MKTIQGHGILQSQKFRSYNGARYFNLLDPIRIELLVKNSTSTLYIFLLHLSTQIMEYNATKQSNLSMQSIFQ